MKIVKFFSVAFFALAVSLAPSVYAVDATTADPLAPAVTPAPLTPATPAMTPTATGVTNTATGTTPYTTSNRTYQTIAVIIGLIVAIMLIAWAVRARRADRHVVDPNLHRRDRNIPDAGVR